MNWLRGDRERVLRRPEERGGQGVIPRVKPLMEIPEKEVALYGILKGFFVELPECPYMHSALRGEVRVILTSLEQGHPGTMRRVVEGQARLSPGSRLCPGLREPCMPAGGAASPPPAGSARPAGSSIRLVVPELPSARNGDPLRVRVDIHPASPDEPDDREAVLLREAHREGGCRAPGGDEGDPRDQALPDHL